MSPAGPSVEPGRWFGVCCDVNALVSREPAPYFSCRSSGGSNVPHDCACSRRARQFLPARAGLRATDPARRIGWGRQCADQRCAIRSRQSQSSLRSQRHRKCIECAATPQQHARTRAPLDAFGTDTRRHAAIFSGRVAADHQRPWYQAEKQGAASPARPPAGLPLHGDLPGVLKTRYGRRSAIASVTVRSPSAPDGQARANCDTDPARLFSG